MIYLWEKHIFTEDEIKRLEASRTNEDYEAITALGLCYARGSNNYPFDRTIATKLLNRAMKYKYAQAYYIYALLVVDPTFVKTIDEAKHVTFLKRSANLGFDRAMSKLGDAFLYGKGVKQSYRDAENFLIKARNKYSVDGLEELAKFYESEGYKEKASYLRNFKEKFRNL